MKNHTVGAGATAVALASVTFIAGSYVSRPAVVGEQLAQFSRPRLNARRFGPFSTANNHGYESPDAISPVVPGPYRAFAGPPWYAVQFIGDAPRQLARDDLEIAVRTSHGRLPNESLVYLPSDLVGYPRRAPASSVQVQFRADRFNRPPAAWTVGMIDRRLPQPPEAYGRELLVVLNAYRRLLGEGAIGFDRPLALAAEAHAGYLAENGYRAPSFHEEDPGRLGFSGKYPWDRDLAFGWPSSLAGEVGIEWNHPMRPALVMASLIDTVYHRLDLFSDNLYAAGAGRSIGPSGAVVLDLGYGYLSRLPPAVVYPYPGQRGVAVAWTDLESPNPMPGGFGSQYGYPVTVDVPTAARLSRVALTLSNRRAPVPVTVVRPGSSALSGNQAAMVPDVVLDPYTVYTVKFSAEAVYQDGHQGRLRLQWKFATGGADLSVVAFRASPDTVQVTVAQSGNGIVEADQPIKICRHGRTIAFGKTDRRGTALFTVAGGGPLWVVAAGGNGMRLASKA